MGYKYTMYDQKDVQSATNTYNDLYNKPPTYSDSTDTKNARYQADHYAGHYKDAIDTGYQSKYSGQIESLYNNYANNKFDWSADGSSEYQAQKDYYQREGQRSQENVQGAYASNTGGYSNSFAQSAGQRAYGQAMDELAQKIPALRNSALQDWSRQQEQTMDQISMLRGFDNDDYQRFRDTVSDYYDFMTYYENKYSTSKGLDMTAFSQELATWSTRLSAASQNLSSIRSTAESQYEHNTVSADTRAAVNQSRQQTDTYYDYANKRLGQDEANANARIDLYRQYL